MSHAATNWAIRQRGLGPARKIVLWHLADCHNAHTGQCNPSQARMAWECEMGRSTLNRHLAALEEAGLIRRVQQFDDATGGQRSTSYTLAFDSPDGGAPPPVDGDADPLSQIGTRSQDVDPAPTTSGGPLSQIGTPPLSQIGTPPVPLVGPPPVPNRDTNPVSKNQVKTRAHTHTRTHARVGPDPEVSAEAQAPPPGPRPCSAHGCRPAIAMNVPRRMIDDPYLRAVATRHQRTKGTRRLER